MSAGPKTSDPDLLARLDAMERTVIVIAELIEGLHVDATTKLAAPLAEMRERHEPKEKPRGLLAEAVYSLAQTLRCVATSNRRAWTVRLDAF